MGTDLGPEFPFERVARELRERITTGEYAPGEQLPSIDDLVADYDYNKDTIRRAMGVLRDEGLVVIRPGLGTFVARR